MNNTLLNSLVNQSLGQFQLLELIGTGGMGAVFRARQASLSRYVAVKVLLEKLSANPGLLERFEREAEMAATLEHPHIVPIYDYGTQRGVSYIAMRLLTGGTLAARMRHREHLGSHNQRLPSLGEVRNLLNKLASALDYAHRRGVIHRDIKANNVLFDDEGEPYLADFGIARLVDATSGLTGTNQAIGTPSHMPPEQWANEDISPATDQYALGVMIYSLLAGRLPFEADTAYEMMHKHVYEPPTPLYTFRPDLPDAVDQVLRRAMAKAPEARYPSVTLFALAFAGAVQGQDETETEFFSFKLSPRLSVQVRSSASEGGERIRGENRTRLVTVPNYRTLLFPDAGKRSGWRIFVFACSVLLLTVVGLATRGLGLFDATPVQRPANTPVTPDEIALAQVPVATFESDARTTEQVLPPASTDELIPEQTAIASITFTQPTLTDTTPLLQSEGTLTPGTQEATSTSASEISTTSEVASVLQGDAREPALVTVDVATATQQAVEVAPVFTATTANTDIPTVQTTPTWTETPLPTFTYTQIFTPAPTDTEVAAPLPTEILVVPSSSPPVISDVSPATAVSPDPLTSAIAAARAFTGSNTDWQPFSQVFNSVEMMLVPAGCFMMGSETGNSDERPVHEQCFSEPFWIDRFEVTNGQFGALGGQAGQRSFWSDADRPREQINWYEARNFCVARGARLPTEREWEYAARGRSNWAYPWGDTFIPENVVYINTAGGETAPVGSRPNGSSWVGAFDMSGNVWEWTESLYQDYPYMPDGSREQDTGSTPGVRRVARGGSWNYSASNQRTSVRIRVPVNGGHFAFGFRCARGL